jgi:cytochrome b subunit of formate dehydrogenase
MSKLNFVLIKTVRWTGWLLLPLILMFLLTGYIMDGRFGLSRLLDERSALTWHRLLHVPLIALSLAHTAAAAWLAFQRWGWIKPRGGM